MWLSDKERVLRLNEQEKVCDPCLDPLNNEKYFKYVYNEWPKNIKLSITC